MNFGFMEQLIYRPFFNACPNKPYDVIYLRSGCIYSKNTKNKFWYSLYCKTRVMLQLRCLYICVSVP